MLPDNGIRRRAAALANRSCERGVRESPLLQAKKREYRRFVSSAPRSRVTMNRPRLLVMCWRTAAGPALGSACAERRGDHHCGVAHVEAAAPRVDHISDPREQPRELLRRYLGVAPERRDRFEPFRSRIGPCPVELPLLGFIERPALADTIGRLVQIGA